MYKKFFSCRSRGDANPPDLQQQHQQTLGKEQVLLSVRGHGLPTADGYIHVCSYVGITEWSERCSDPTRQPELLHAPQERHLYTHPAGPHHYVFSHMFLKGKPANSANALLGRKDKCIWAYSHDARAGISEKKCMNYKHPYEHGKSETHSWIKKRKSTLQRRHNIMM